jgi:hypothetical protein
MKTIEVVITKATVMQTQYKYCSGCALAVTMKQILGFPVRVGSETINKEISYLHSERVGHIDPPFEKSDFDAMMREGGPETFKTTFYPVAGLALDSTTQI